MRSGLMYVGELSIQGESPAVEEHHERGASEDPLDYGRRWTRKREADRNPQGPAHQKSEQMRPEVDALACGAEHGQDRQAGAEGHP